ncbi:MAG: TIM barrel protein [Planctomycetota bacterium]
MKALLLCDSRHPEEVARLCTARGLGMEMQSFYDPTYVERESGAIELHRRAVEAVPLRALHAPFWDLCPGSRDPRVQELARERMERACSIAQALSAEHVVVHHAFIPHMHKEGEYLERSLPFWDALFDEAPAGLHFHVENILDEEPEGLAALVDRIGRANVDVNLDVGHAHCFSKIPVVEWIARLGERIGYAHLHANHGERDEHLALGEGTLPMREACEALNRHAPGALWAVECEAEDLEAALAWLEENGFIEAAEKKVRT